MLLAPQPKYLVSFFVLLVNQKLQLINNIKQSFLSHSKILATTSQKN
jgi:hypothetical protein